MNCVRRRLSPTTAAFVILLAIAGMPAAAEDRPREIVEPEETDLFVGDDGSFQFRPAAASTPGPAAKELSGACTSCYTCAIAAAVCVVECSRAAATKNPYDIAICALCIMGLPVTARPCGSACWSCLTGDRAVACKDYNSWTREMCTTEQWVCCNGANGCTSCAPYGGYCPADTFACGYGNRTPTTCDGGFENIEVVRQAGIRAEDVDRETRGAKAGAGDAHERRFRPSGGRWRQWGGNAVYKVDCDGDGDGGGGSGGGTGGGDDGGGGDTTCTHCSCQGEFTSWEGTVCGRTTEELVDACWNSCY